MSPIKDEALARVFDLGVFFRWFEEQGLSSATNCRLTPDGVWCKECHRPLDIVDEDLGSRTCRCGAATVLERRGR